MATKYVSSLTGPEMDASLIDMAYHNSEAYAVGTRNGVAVGSSDVTYHNNAKYYASQTGADVQAAEAAAARAEAAVPSGTAGAVFFDRAQSLTTAQQAQARANIMAGGTNPNLLDNWYFVGGGSQLGDGIFPINQRGQTSYTGSATTGIDRWWQQYDTNVQLTSAGLRITGSWDIQQRFAQPLPNGTYTLSIDAAVVNSTGAIFGFADANGQQINSFSLSKTGISSTTLTSNEIARVYMNLAASGSVGDITIRAMKLEKGTVSTLANDVPPDFGEELRKCRRYLRYVPLIRSLFTFQSAYTIAVKTLEGIEMASYPTAALVQAGTAIQFSNSASATPTSVAITAFNYNIPTIQIGLSSALDGVGYILDTVISLSCEL